MTRDEAIKLAVEALEETGKCSPEDGECKDCDLVRESLAALRTASGWQPIGDLHKSGEWDLWVVFMSGAAMRVPDCRWNEDDQRWIRGSFFVSGLPTHAMPLPSPPKEGE